MNPENHSIPSHFEKTVFNYPALITNSIVVIEETMLSQKHLERILKNFDLLGTRHAAFIFEGQLTLSTLKMFYKIIESSFINEFIIFCQYSKELDTDNLLDIVCSNNRLSKLVFLNSPVDNNLENFLVYRNVDFSTYKRLRQLNKKWFFTSNRILFSESQAHHTYFNRKLYIGPNGEIKNAPECPETFGYIQDLESPEELKAIVQTPEFQKYWFVHKEITDVCKDCEFRHMCVDNRLPFQRAENEWYHQTECNYNPYIAKWQGEEGYRTLAECGVISNENGFSIDHEKIAEINKELWGED